jgi:hypothetical protein
MWLECSLQSAARLDLVTPLAEAETLRSQLGLLQLPLEQRLAQAQVPQEAYHCQSSSLLVMLSRLPSSDQGHIWG